MASNNRNRARSSGTQPTARERDQRPRPNEWSHYRINDAIDPQERACQCGARATRRSSRAQCHKCRRRDRWHRHQDGARRHQREEQW